LLIIIIIIIIIMIIIIIYRHTGFKNKNITQIITAENVLIKKYAL